MKPDSALQQSSDRFVHRRVGPSPTFLVGLLPHHDARGSLRRTIAQHAQERDDRVDLVRTQCRLRADGAIEQRRVDVNFAPAGRRQIVETELPRFRGHFPLTKSFRSKSARDSTSLSCARDRCGHPVDGARLQARRRMVLGRSDKALRLTRSTSSRASARRALLWRSPLVERAGLVHDPCTRSSVGSSVAESVTSADRTRRMVISMAINLFLDRVIFRR